MLTRQRGPGQHASSPAPRPVAVGPISAVVRAAAAAALVNRASHHQANTPPLPCPVPVRHPQASPAASAPRQSALVSMPAQVAPPPPKPVLAPSPHPQELNDGTVLAEGRYWVGPLLGRGSFGITYRGMDQRLNRDVAIKEFFPEGSFRHAGTIVPPASLGRDGYEQERRHFIEEARVLAQFQRPGIVTVYEVFEQNDTAYMVMEHIEGRTLIEVLKAHNAPLPPVDALRYILAVADALAAVHAQHLLHRDVKPGNIMITPADQAVLIDFGAARRFDRYQRTSVMTAIGTPGYAPLEQWGSSGRFGPTSDVYALAATMYHLITGQMPPSAADRAANETLQPPRTINQDVPELVSEAIVQALAVRMEDRPQTMAAFASGLRSARTVRSQPPAAATLPGTALPPVSAAPVQSDARHQSAQTHPATQQAGQRAAERQAVQRPHTQQREQQQTSLRRMHEEQARQAGQRKAEQMRAVERATATRAVVARRRRRFPWPRRQRDIALWAAGSVLAPAVFVTSVATIATLVPFLAICSGAPSWRVRRLSRLLLRHSLRLSLDGIGISTVSLVSLVLMAGLTARSAARGTLAPRRARRRLTP